MHHNCFSFKQFFDNIISGIQVIYPDRRIYKNHLENQPNRRRGGAQASGSEPPRRASLRAASFAIKPSSAIRIKVARSFTPVSSAARANNSSSMFIVVLMASFIASIDAKVNAHQLSIQSLKKLSCAARRSVRGMSKRESSCDNTTRHSAP
jgi:hypothetical protein